MNNPAKTPIDPEFRSPEKLRAYGDFVFLALRSPHHRQMNMTGLEQAFDAPISLGQFRIFRFDDIPRGLFTWAYLGPEAEHRLVGGQSLRPQDWRSGEHLWLIDLIAPYPGLIRGMSRWIMQKGNFAKRDFYFRRVKDGDKTRRILHVDLDHPTKKARMLSNRDFPG